MSEGFGQAKTLMTMPPSIKKHVLSLLYSPTRGAGLTILRNEISADAGFTIEPRAPSSPTAKPSYLTLAAVDQDQGQLWLAKRINADYGASVFADAWSAPAFMKTSHSAINGGTVCGVPGARCKSGDWRQAYANYLVQYAKDYAGAGVPLSYVGPENEGNFSVPQDTAMTGPNTGLVEVKGNAARAQPSRCAGARVTPYLTDTSHELSAQTPITVRKRAFTATLPPRSLVSYDS